MIKPLQSSTNNMNNFNFFNFTTCKTTSQCCICLEKNKKPGYQCILCNRGVVCRNCVPQLCESGMCNKCPVCRQENWRDIKINQTVVIPITQTDVMIVESDGEKKEDDLISCCEQLPPCRTLMDGISTLGSMLFVSYILGVFTICEAIPLSYQNWEPVHHILALVIGIAEAFLISYCCWYSLCYQRNDSY